MKFDENAPKPLVEMQTWFAQTITMPLADDHRLPKEKVQKQAEYYINPRPQLTSQQRMEIYHQQYWFRLLENLQQIYPTMTALLGVRDFNHRIAIPYLFENPSQHWSLAHLGLTLPNWIADHYEEIDAPLILKLATIDQSYQNAFLATQKKNEVAVSLAPHVHLFSFNADLFAFRSELLAHPIEYWQTHPFPEINYSSSYVILFRNKEHRIVYEYITAEDYGLLQQFSKSHQVDADNRSLIQTWSDKGWLA